MFHKESECFTPSNDDLGICKSMSKAYANSGILAGYLCAHPMLIESLRPFIPPWAVSLPAQIAATNAF